jgi:proline dehydrogenase
MLAGVSVVNVKAIARRAAFRLATSDQLERAVLALGPLRALAFRHGRRYVAGTDERAALAAVQALERTGLAASVDLFGENVADPARADSDTRRYLALAGMLAEHPGTYVSLDCSHLGLDQDPAGCRARVASIAHALPDGSRLQLGAEESTRADAILDVAHHVAREGLPIMVTVQANLRRSSRDVEAMAEAGIPVRLCKGAYVEPPAVAHRWGPETDAAFVRLARQLDGLGAEHSLATHDPMILAQLLAAGAGRPIEFLLGVREDDARRLAQAGHRVRVYVP